MDNFFAYESINDLKVQGLDYKWLKECDKPSHLLKGLDLLEEDGKLNIFFNMTFY